MLENDIKACGLCRAFLPLGPKPLVQIGAGDAPILIIGQAPGRKAHDSGIPWNDQSGDRLRHWLGVTREDFYDSSRIAILPMGFCYPGTGKSGDLPPRPECAPRWHGVVLESLRNRQLTLLVGSYAQKHYLGKRRKTNLTETVRAWRDYIDGGFLPLVHPSPRNDIWLHKNPWFESEVVPYLRKRAAMILGE